MSEPAPTIPPETPEAPPENRLARALDLVCEEATETMRRGRDSRAFHRANTLLTIAKALRKEMGSRVADFDDGSSSQKDITYTTGNNIVLGEELTVDGVDTLEWDQRRGACKRPRGARQDLEREKELAQLESLEARRRRDEAATRTSMLEEFRQLQEIHESGLSDELREGIEERLAEISEQLKTEEKPCETAPTAEGGRA